MTHDELKEIANKALDLGALQIEPELIEFLVLLDNHRPQVGLEIGSWNYGTFYALRRLVSDLLISVDINGKYADVGHSFGGNTAIVIGDSQQIMTYEQVRAILKERPLDILFIDGDHAYVSVKRDYELYSQLVRPGGLVAFHDIKDTNFHRRLGCQVSTFWSELLGRKWEFKTRMFHGMDWGGIGVLQKE
jgi:predicted O-methyltransferase YrrM